MKAIVAAALLLGSGVLVIDPRGATAVSESSSAPTSALFAATAAQFANDDPIVVVTATLSDRGANTTPFLDDIFETVFNDTSVVQITRPAVGAFSSEERTAVLFPANLVPRAAPVVSAQLLLTPQGGPSRNIGLSPGEVGEVYAYAGDGSIDVDDMTAAGKVLVATIVGPTPNGAVSVPLSLTALASITFPPDLRRRYLGLMFRGQPGAGAVTYSFSGTYSGIPLAWRPHLRVTYRS